jgi:hypothetical protein
MKDFQDTPIIQKIYDFYRDLYLSVEKMPKKDKYSVGLRAQDITLDLIEAIFAASNSSGKEKVAPLEKAGAKVDLLKLLVRLTCEIKAVDQKKYLNFEEQLQEIGKMIGGWLKYSRQ